jgi:glucosamine kinase
MSLLIADSGSSKTDWMIIKNGKLAKTIQTSGLNPFFCDENKFASVILEELKLSSKEIDALEDVVFYGAGVKDSTKSKFVEKQLSKHFNTNRVSAYSDMLAAARATCGMDKGVCCILGTGSNSAYYDGKKIKTQNPSLGFMLGDEGSGTYLGKKVLQYYFYNTFDDELKEAFLQQYGGDLTDILNNVYHRPFPNKYIASFTSFLIDHRGHYMVENIIEDSLIDFHQKHVLKYRESWKYPVHFVGTVAYEFRDIIKELHASYGLVTGTITKAPKNGLVAYHTQ